MDKKTKTIRITTVQTEAHLQGILDLQNQNLSTNISEKEALEQGFVTVHHDLSLLQKMNEPYPHIIAIEGDDVVGYALVMLRTLANEIPVLIPMFEQVNQMTYKGEALVDSKYLIMGQVCIAKTHRGQGLFTKLYEALVAQMAPDFDYLITEIAARNTRSRRAHNKVGFVPIKAYRADDGVDWVMVILEL